MHNLNPAKVQSISAIAINRKNVCATDYNRQCRWARRIRNGVHQTIPETAP